jgi:DNA (cytosine-5)-methyltransferase 1
VIVGSVCSGIGAPECAWRDLGWHQAFMSEIEPFPRAVLAQRFPGVPIHGDFTTIKAGEYEPIDLLVGGTPCQSFSVAGLRGGLADERGNLALEFLRLADRLKPRWIVWENVPGVLSSSGGRDFGAFLGGLVQLGYGFAYRVLDAQHFGVAQRRRRVFVVGYLGDWRRAAAVLFEPASLRRHPAPRREAGERVAEGADGGSGSLSHWDGEYPHPTLNQSASGSGGVGASNQEIFSQRGAYLAPATARCLTTGEGNRLDGESCTFVPYTLAIRGRNGSHDLEYRQDGLANTLLTPNGGRAGIGVGAVAFDLAQITSAANRTRCEPGLPSPTLAKQSRMHVATSAVRRLTPRECAKLQGFPPWWCEILYRGKPAADGPQYKALGNSMAVPVLRWIGGRIQMQEVML